MRDVLQFIDHNPLLTFFTAVVFCNMIVKVFGRSKK